MGEARVMANLVLRTVCPHVLQDEDELEPVPGSYVDAMRNGLTLPEHLDPIEGSCICKALQNFWKKNNLKVCYIDGEANQI